MLLGNNVDVKGDRKAIRLRTTEGLKFLDTWANLLKKKMLSYQAEFECVF